MTYALTLLFLLAAPQPKLWSFAVIGDTQRNWHIAVKAVNAMHAAKVAFAVNVGDIYNCASPRMWRQARRLFESHLFMCWVLGNHELKICGRYRRYKPWSYRRLWRKHFRQRRSCDKTGGSTFAACGSRPDKTGPWNDVHMLLLDSATPGIHTAQLRWLKAELAGKGPFILFSHRPLPCRTCRGWWYRKMDPMPHRWRNVLMRRVLDKVRRKIIAVFHGHWHGFVKYRADGIRSWCTGGGGGLLAKGHTYHWLRVDMRGKKLIRVMKMEIR